MDYIWDNFGTKVIRKSFPVFSIFPYLRNHLAYCSKCGSVKLEDSDRLVCLSSLYRWVLLLINIDFNCFVAISVTLSKAFCF